MPLQYQVPQFVDVEDRIIGPLTAKQFLMFVICTLLVAAIYVSFPLPVTVVTSTPIIIFFLLLAFYHVNGRSFIWFLYAVLHFLLTGKMFVWERRGETPRVRLASTSAIEAVHVRRGVRMTAGRVPTLESRIQQLARILDTAGKVVDDDLPLPRGLATL